MKKIVAFRGSPRPQGNSSLLLQSFIDGAKKNNAEILLINAYKANINYCMGCLRCNILGHCSIETDDWKDISSKILDADVLVFASPIYFHHISAPLKKILDRFRSFVKIQMTETGLIHTPWQKWDKDLVLLLSMGTSEDIDAQPVIDLFGYIREFLGENNRLHYILGKRLAMAKQITMPESKLKILYSKLQLPIKLAEIDAVNNKRLLDNAYDLGFKLSQ